MPILCYFSGMNNSPAGGTIAAPIRLIVCLMCCFFASLSAPALAQQSATTAAKSPGLASTQQAAPTATISLLTTGPRSSLRGLSVANDSVVWVSGSKGTVGKSLDGGKTWTWQPVPGFENRDFRDIEFLDAKTAVIMAIDPPADILRTTDGGNS